MTLLLITLTVLQGLFQTLETKTLQADIVISVTNAKTQPMTYQGTLVMQNRKFILHIIDTEMAYDGNTLYTYQSGTDELTLSTPTQDELLAANPMVYAANVLQSHHITERTDSQGVTISTLTPKDKGKTTTRIVVRSKQNIPLSIELYEGTRTTSCQFRNSQFIPKAPSFVLTKEGAYINDLRDNK